MLEADTGEDLLERFMLRVPPDLTPEIAARRWRQINLMLRSPLLLQSQAGDGDLGRVILELARSIVSAERGLFYLCEGTADRVTAAADFGFAPGLPERLRSVNAMGAAAMRSRKPLLVRRDGTLALARALRLMGSASCLSVPMLRRGEPWGVIQLIRKERFGEDDGILLWIYALILEGTLTGLAGPGRALHQPPARPPDRPSASRAPIERQVEAEIEMARLTASPCSLLRVVWRPEPGGSTGPSVLHAPRVLRMIRGVLRPVDLVAPWGTGDLLIFLPQADACGAVKAIQVLRQRLVRSRCLESQETRARSALQFAYAACPAQGERLEDLLREVGRPEQSGA